MPEGLSRAVSAPSLHRTSSNSSTSRTPALSRGCHTESFGDILDRISEARNPLPRSKSAGLIFADDRKLQAPPHVNTLLDWARGQARHKPAWTVASSVGRPFEKEVKPMAVGSLKSVWELNRLDYPRRSCPPRGIQSHTYAGRPHNQPVWAPTDTNSRPMDVDYRPKAMYPPRKLLPLPGHPAKDALNGPYAIFPQYSKIIKQQRAEVARKYYAIKRAAIAVPGVRGRPQRQQTDKKQPKRAQTAPARSRRRE